MCKFSPTYYVLILGVLLVIGCSTSIIIINRSEDVRVKDSFDVSVDSTNIEAGTKKKGKYRPRGQ